MYPQFQNSQELALDGAVIFDTLANDDKSHAGGAWVFCIQYEFGSWNENVLCVKMGYYKTLWQTNWAKI